MQVGSSCRVAIVVWKSLRRIYISGLHVQDRESTMEAAILVLLPRKRGDVDVDPCQVRHVCELVPTVSVTTSRLQRACSKLRHISTFIRLSSSRMYISYYYYASNILPPPCVLLLRAWREIACTQIRPSEAIVVVPLIVPCYWICACAGRHGDRTRGERWSGFDVRSQR